LKSGIPVRFGYCQSCQQCKIPRGGADHVDEKSILNEKLDSFEMNFMKELSLNDTVVIHENFSEESTIFSITKEDKTCFALQLNWK
jgi:hypothetical protein